ncbi:MAG: aspartate--tRNA(Asp/Asn) ligase [Bacillota bacterium]
MLYRSHVNGSLRLKDVGQSVTLIGWVQRKRNLGSLLFIDLRDRSGIVQLMIKDPTKVPDIKNEYLIQIQGVISKKAVANPSLATGEIEVEVSNLKVINESEVLPLIVDDVTDAGEDIRLQYRYLDLRRKPMQDILITRSKILTAFHAFFAKHDFTNIETPLLTLSTPGGARDFLVPSRLTPGSFYALPQSPQIYKQLLMIGGLERYYQIARCFRDEDLRADRQPDFTQIDVEASFLSQDELLNLMEAALREVFQSVKGLSLPQPFPRLSYEKAMALYGTDKPDLRFDLPLSSVPTIIKNAYEKAGFESSNIKGLKLANAAGIISRKILDEWTTFVKPFGIKGLVMFKHDQGQLQSSFLKFVAPESVEELTRLLDLKPGDVYLIASHADLTVLNTAMGILRTRGAKLLNLVDEKKVAIAWVTDFPLFDTNDEGQLVAAHHPFTRPQDIHLPLLQSQPKKVLAQAYDLVINGYEAGGGSMRIYDKAIQKQIFSLLGMSEEAIQKKFGWFIQAFNYGTPPHGGIAFGLDRLTMIMAGTDNIKDVIAFPKNLKMVGLLEGTPNTVETKQLDELSIQLKEKK